MDYDEKARSMVGYIGPKHVAEVAAALRESAAEAFEEAAKISDEMKMAHWKQRGHVPMQLRQRAAALRSTTRGKP